MEAIIIRSFTIRNPPMARILALDFLAPSNQVSRVGLLVRERVRLIGKIARGPARRTLEKERARVSIEREL